VNGNSPNTACASIGINAIEATDAAAIAPRAMRLCRGDCSSAWGACRSGQDEKHGDQNMHLWNRFQFAGMQV
jgi:hypothetical protein